MSRPSLAGYGKTTSAIIAILDSIDTESDIIHCQSVFIVPTREEVTKVAATFTQLGALLGVKVHGIGGATTIREDMRILHNGNFHVIASTLSRFHDIIILRRLVFDMSHVKTIIFD